MHRYRTHTCNELRKENIGENVRLSGWLRNRRDHSKLVFIDLADHYGITQLVISEEKPFYKDFCKLPKETVICIDGEVGQRSSVNKNYATGEIEVVVEKFEVLNTTENLPITVFPEEPTSEDLRLQYRFLDLRREAIHKNIVLRSKVISSIRRRMEELGFLEYQTPILTSSSPEGARDYLVPSRRYPGHFYALPQAPQQFKQLLMVSGFDRYFQIAPCFRDEDARADRSPGEFYQLDVEMSYVTQDDVFEAIEKLMYGLFKEFRPKAQITGPTFPKVTYEETMLKYGTDKPDLRNPLEIVDVTSAFGNSDFAAFKGKTVRAIHVANCGKSNRFYSDMQKFTNNMCGIDIAWIGLKEDKLRGSIARFVTGETKDKVFETCGVAKGSAVFFMAHENAATVSQWMGTVRNELGERLELLEKGAFRFCWITDFPYFELEEETQKMEFSHNPFSMPQGGLEALENSDPLSIKAFQYDIVCNGYELSSGAIRNHDPKIMYKAFEMVGYKKEDVDKEFGGMINALKYGAPPHGGLAPGVDRIVMLLAGCTNIREVIAFPMNQSAQDLMMGAPGEVLPQQLEELHLRICYPQGNTENNSKES